MRKRFRIALTLLLVGGLGRAVNSSAQSLTERYGESAARILEAAAVDEGAWEKLAYLTTHIGHRLSGSDSLERAIDWAVEGMNAEGLEGVHEQPVEVPHWVRGREWLRMKSPSPRELRILGLGGSVSTGGEPVRAPAIVVESFDELRSLGRRVAGRIVVFAMPWSGYGATVPYRYRAASRSAELGAVAALVRSATNQSLSTPHTGGMSYAANVPKIPAAAITVEDAEWMKRLQADGVALELELFMEAEWKPPASSANVVAEIRGSELPDEVVVMGGHLDSWDVGQGAHDDGAACVAAWHALTLLDRLGLRPRRTLRVVLWTNEENGLAGARAYRDGLGDEISSHVAAIEMDGGAEQPVGFGFSVGRGYDTDGPEAGRARELLEEIANLLDPIEAGTILEGGRDADIGPLIDGGVPGLGLRTVMKEYFAWHHTEADTLDKVDPENLRRAVAMLAVMGYVLADMPDRLVPRRRNG